MSRSQRLQAGLVQRVPWHLLLRLAQADGYLLQVQLRRRRCLVQVRKIPYVLVLARLRDISYSYMLRKKTKNDRFHIVIADQLTKVDFANVNAIICP